MKDLSSREHSVFWFRRDLRLEDNHGLSEALKSGRPVVPVFIFDRKILENLPKRDTRVAFIHQRLADLAEQLGSRGASLQVFYGKPEAVWRDILAQKKTRAIFCNEDYEPYAIQRDNEVAALAQKQGVTFCTYKDQVIFAKDEVLKDDGEPYRVFTPFARKWKTLLQPQRFQPYLLPGDNFLPQIQRKIPALEDLGFEKSTFVAPSTRVAKKMFQEYSGIRNHLVSGGTSHLGVHLRFGTISLRKLAAAAHELSEIFLNELIWREFFMQILYHFPHTVDHPFDHRYKRIEWLNDPSQFKRWCEGETGYPLVDAGMRELNATGFMHNRARMITASFLTKHLLIDWKWGERYFAEKLLDFELASNVGNWQWAAGCGCDAAPYFRIFNPSLQQRKFDPENIYVKSWIPELESARYPSPIVDHEMARRRALVAYRKALEVQS